MPIKRPFLLYTVLAVLFVITLAYEIRYTRDILRDERISQGLVVVSDASNRIGFVDSVASSAGVHVGDALLAVNGVPYTGTGMLASAFAHARPGTPTMLTMLSQGGSESKNGSGPKERTVSIPVKLVHPGFWEIVGDLVLHFALPAISILLGFWVAAVRPREPLAWLLLALMLTFPHILETYRVSGWGPGWSQAGMLYHVTLGRAFPIVLFLFGRFFPESFPKGRLPDRIWNLQQWLLALPFAVLILPFIIISVGQINNYKSVAALNNFFSPFGRVAAILLFALIGSFFSAIGIKHGMSQSPDAKRRLRFVYWGALAAFTPPLLVLTLYPAIVSKSPSAIFPQWFIVIALLPLVLFPISLAYSIVVQKAMGVGVALRQGIQYALARSGIRVLQFLAIAVAISAAATMATNASNRPQKIIAIAAGILAWFAFRRVGDRLRIWLDLRFFREAYNAEQILAELSDQVHSMVETKSLLETVVSRLSQTLHVSQVAVLLRGGDLYQPAFAMGFADLSSIAFSGNKGTAKMLERENEPARVYFKDRESWLYQDDEINQEERSKLAALQAELLLPLAVRHKLLGFISLGPKRSEEPYTGTDIRLLKSVATQTGMALENAHLMSEIARETAQRERLNREIEIAREVQERLFPQTLPTVEGLDYTGHCQPVLGVGGDYYDFLALAGSRLGVAIGDVSGKGIAAALMMASLQASLRGEVLRGAENLAAAVGNVNRLVYEVSSVNRYATFFYGEYDPCSHTFHYVNAGHNPPMLFRPDNDLSTIIRLEVGGTVVGMLENAPYEQGSVLLAPGDILALYTDGISEAMNAEGEEWGEERLMEVIRNCNCRPAHEMLQSIFTAADGFVAGAKQHDDMTLVILRVTA